MFGFLRRKAEPHGPFEFEHSVEIAKPAAEVYALVDWADARKAVPGRSYAFANEITPPVGRLVSSNETYSVEPLGESSCRLALVVSASFDGRLSMDDLAMEAMMMGMSGQNALAKLKIQAERGVDAVHAAEAMQMDGLDPFADFGS